MVDNALDELLAPLSADDPCGPDLDLAGDMNFMNALARADGMLPGAYFEMDPGGERERPFDRAAKKLDFAAEVAASRELLKRSRDLRLIVNLAKFAILDRKVDEFVDAVETIARLLDQHWDEVNPRAEDGDFSFRMAALQALDDRVHILLPLQFTPLIRHPRLGPIAFRARQIADGLDPRPGEEAPDAGTIERAMMDVELETLVRQRDQFARLKGAADRINEITEDRVGSSMSADLKLLRDLADQILGFLDGFVGKRDPGAALAPPPDGFADAGADGASDGDATELSAGPARAGPVGPVASIADVAATLGGVSDYFDRFEPSSPALLLVRQAAGLVGKSFIEVMQILLPDHVDDASIGIGRRETFPVPVNRLSAFAGDGGGAPEVEQNREFVDRNSALAALQQVETYYANREPTSPIPFLCERARRFATRDFLSILKEVLPESTLRSIDGG